MSKIAYIACSYQDRHLYKSVVEAITGILTELGWKSVVPVFDLSHIDPDEHTEIMNESFKLLGNSSLLIVEASEKNIGIGIEVGYAKALNIPTIYFYKNNAALSTTVAGTVKYTYSYISIDDVRKKVKQIVLKDSSFGKNR